MKRIVAYQLRIEGALGDTLAQQLGAGIAYARRTTLPRAASDRARTLLGIALARCCLSLLQGRRVAAQELEFASGCKPRLRGSADTSFSIAHSGPWVLAAAAESRGEQEVCEIGVDLEWLPAAPALAGENGALSRWVRREAAAKCLGRSLIAFVADASAGEALHFAALTVPDCVAWLASSATLPQIEAHALSMAQLCDELCIPSRVTATV